MTVELLEPVNPEDQKTVYIPRLIRATVLSGSEGSIPFDGVLSESTGIIRLRARLLPGINTDWYARVYNQFYRVSGVRNIPPRGILSEIVLEQTKEVKVADFLSLKGKRLTLKNKELTI